MTKFKNLSLFITASLLAAHSWAGGSRDLSKEDIHEVHQAAATFYRRLYPLPFSPKPQDESSMLIDMSESGEVARISYPGTEGRFHFELVNGKWVLFRFNQDLTTAVDPNTKQNPLKSKADVRARFQDLFGDIATANNMSEHVIGFFPHCSRGSRTSQIAEIRLTQAKGGADIVSGPYMSATFDSSTGEVVDFAMDFSVKVSDKKPTVSEEAARSLGAKVMGELPKELRMALSYQITERSKIQRLAVPVWHCYNNQGDVVEVDARTGEFLGHHRLMGLIPEGASQAPRASPHPTSASPRAQETTGGLAAAIAAAAVGALAALAGAWWAFQRSSR